MLLCCEDSVCEVERVLAKGKLHDACLRFSGRMLEGGGALRKTVVCPVLDAVLNGCFVFSGCMLVGCGMLLADGHAICGGGGEHEALEDAGHFGVSVCMLLAGGGAICGGGGEREAPKDAGHLDVTVCMLLAGGGAICGDGGEREAPNDARHHGSPAQQACSRCWQRGHLECAHHRH